MAFKKSSARPKSNEKIKEEKEKREKAEGDFYWAS
jgi:hypothetical protein